MCFGPVVPAYADGIGEWFRTAEQRAAARWAEGDHEALAAEAPDARWEALGRYGAGDHDGAADAFARALASGDERLASERDALRFGQATAATRAGRLDEALSLYDELLAADPDDADARHNRDIARALQALEEREPPPRGADPDASSAESSDEGGEDAEGGEGEKAGQAGEGQQDGDREGERSEDRQAGSGGEERREADDPSSADAAAGERRETGNELAREPGTSGRDAASSGDADTDSLEQAARAAQEAREALAAEAQRQAEEGAVEERARDEPGEDGNEDDAVARERKAPSEGEQATEQWLRRIPDDPAGLLRARLLQTHRDDYPEVGDGDEPW